MITVTLQEAKAKLNSLIESALAGEDVVLLRGAKIVARIQPLSDQDIELSPQLTDDQAKRFWDEIEASPKKRFSSAEAAVKYLRKKNK